MNPRTSLLVVAAFVGLLTACGPSVQPVPYVPQPERVAKPREALSALVLANTAPGCQSQNGYAPGMFVVKFACVHGVGSNVLRFDRIESLKISHEGPWYYVRVHHRGGVDDFYWASKSLEDAQGMADAITAIANSLPPPSSQPTGSHTT